MIAAGLSRTLLVGARLGAVLRNLLLLTCGLTCLNAGAEPTPATSKPARALALNALQAREPDPARIAHALAVEAIMRGLAERLRGDREEWGLAGLLHDIDLPETRNNMSQHGLVGAKLIVELGFSRAVADAVASHDDSTGVARHAPMDRALYCADRAFWAISASGVDIAKATPEAVVGALKEKARTGRIDAKLEEACAVLGLTIDELLSIGLGAIRRLP
jgi:uncharacterized protein